MYELAQKVIKISLIRIIRCRTDVIDDLTQDGLERLLRRNHRRPIQDLKAYCTTIGRRLAIRWFLQQNRYRHSDHTELYPCGYPNPLFMAILNQTLNMSTRAAAEQLKIPHMTLVDNLDHLHYPTSTT